MNIPSRINDPLEFDFGGHGKMNGPKKESSSMPLEKDPTAVVFKGPDRPSHFQTSQESPKGIPMNATMPTAIHARQNIERQKREQKTMNTIIGGAASTLFLFVLLVGALASLGGYVLWKQIDRQSTTIALLEANMRQEMIALRSDLEKANQQISEDLVHLQSVSESQRTLIENMGAGLQTQRDKSQRQDLQIKQMDSRLKDLERTKYFKR